MSPLASRTSRWAAAWAVALVTTAANADVPRIRATPLGSLAGGSTEAVQINGAGLIGGQSGHPFIAGGGMHAFVSQGAGPLTPLDTLGFHHSDVQALNEVGQVAGIGIIQDGAYYFRRVFRAGAGQPMFSVAGFAGEWGQVNAVNNAGDIVGVWDMQAGPELRLGGFRYTDDAGMTPLQSFGGPESWASDITDNGAIVGWAQMPDGSRRAAFWHAQGFLMQLIPWQWGVSSQLIAINNEEYMIGEVVDELGRPNGVLVFFFCPVMIGAWVDPQAAYVTTDVLSESGVVAGTRVSPQGDTRPYLLNAKTFEVTLIDLPEGQAAARPLALNNHGHMLVQALTEQYEPSLLLWTKERGYTDLTGTLVATFGTPFALRTALNDLDQIVVTAEPVPNTRAAALIEVLPPCPGDLNADNAVNQSDLGIVLGDFGCSGPQCVGDVDGDGVVNQSDLGVLLAAFGTTCE